MFKKSFIISFLGKLVLGTLLFILLSVSLYGQSAPRLVSFPTPNAASFSLYSDIPVSKFTGIPQINVPLYEFQEENVKVSVNLSYHAGGVRVHSRPGWVGLGWSLQCAGAITRVMHGKIDEYKYRYSSSNQYSGFYGTFNKLNGTDTDWLSTSRLNDYRDDYVPSLNNPLNEAMPDEFDFNFLGHSGTFFIDHTGAWKVISDEDIKIEFNPTTDGFINEQGLRANIRDRINYYGSTNAKTGWSDRYFNKFTLVTADGTRYEFGGIDATEYSVPFREQEYAHVIPVTWFLTKVITPTGKTITYTYVPADPIYNLSQQVMDHYVDRDVNNSGWTNLAVDCGSWVYETAINGEMMFPVYLSSISYAGGYIEFHTSVSNNQLRWPSDAQIDGLINHTSCHPIQNGIVPVYFRDPCGGSGDSGWGEQFKWHQLDSIRIREYKSESVYLSRYRFTYTNSNTTRLKLLSVQEKSLITNEVKPPYLFTYNPTPLPSYAEFNRIDHWDFYNGNTNAFPSYNQPIASFETPYYTFREPDVTGNFMRAETLEKIQYPTGGVVKFDFEPHAYSAYVQRQVLPNPPVTYPLNTLTQNNIAGGLRIKRISVFDKASDVTPKLITDYYYLKNYTNGVSPEGLVSSGILGGAAQYYWLYQGRDLENQPFTYRMFSSGSLLPFGYNTAGYHIGYSEVVEVERNATGKTNGFTKFKYTNFDSGPEFLDEVGLTNDVSRSIYSPFTSKELMRGKLLSEEVYSAISNQPIRSKVNTYTATSSDYVRRVKQEWFVVCLSTALAQTVYVTAYKTYAFRYNLTQSVVTEWDGSNGLATSTTFEYTPQNFLKRQTRSNSDGTVTETSMRYPLDFTSSTTLIGSWEAEGLSKLVQKNIISVPIETIIKRNNKVMIATAVNYKVFGSNVFPHKKWIFRASDPLSSGVPINNTVGNEPNLFNPANLFLNSGNWIFGRDEHYTTNPETFNAYDLNGNVRDYLGTDNIPVTYLWSYGRTKPIAEIIGVTYAQLPATVNGVPLDNIQTGYQDQVSMRTLLSQLRSSVPQAQITTYTYNTFGVTSKTDLNGRTTYYAYDGFGRLLTAKDHEGNIVKAFKYKFFSEP